nr:JmjC domain-containing protein [Tanacetum cinerariifolium]
MEYVLQETSAVRKMVVSNSNQEDGTTQNVDLDALRALANATVAADSDIPSEDGTTQNVDLDALRALANAVVAADSDIPFGNTLHVPAASPCVPTVGPPGTFDVPPAPSAGPPGTSDVPPVPSAIPSCTFGVSSGPSVAPTAALAVLADSLKVPAADPADSSNVPAGVFSKGKSPMVEEDIPVKARTFRQMEEDRLGEEAAKRLHAEEMAVIDRQRAEAQRQRQQEVLESAMFYNEADWLNIRAYVESNASISKTLLGDDVSEDNFPARMTALIKKKRQALAEQLFKESRTLKRPGPVLEEPSTKRPKSPVSPTPSMPDVPISHAVTAPPFSRIRQKSLGQKPMHKPKSTFPTLDLDAPAQMFIKVVVDEDSDDEDSVDEVWSAAVGWEVLPTPLGEINAIYRIDVVQYYEHDPATGAGLLFWGDLQVLFDSQAGGKGFSVS